MPGSRVVPAVTSVLSVTCVTKTWSPASFATHDQLSLRVACATTPALQVSCVAYFQATTLDVQLSPEPVTRTHPLLGAQVAGPQRVLEAVVPGLPKHLKPPLGLLGGKRMGKKNKTHQPGREVVGML